VRDFYFRCMSAIEHQQNLEPESEEAVGFRDQPICLRALRTEDRLLLEDLARRTGSDDLRMRFFTGFQSLPPRLLNELMRIDPKRRITLVASRATSRGQPEMLAIAHAHTSAKGEAELALLVRSDLKGMGLGSLLLETLVARCRRRGLKVLVADVLQENTRMLRLAEKHGFRSESAELGTTRLVLTLDSLAA